MSDYFDEDPWAVPAAGEEPIDYRQADQPADEAQTANPIPSKKETTVTDTIRTDSEGKVVTTIKFGAGYDAPWVVFHSSDLTEAEQTLNRAKGHLELVARVSKFAKGLDAGSAPARSNSNNAPARQQQSPPPGAESKTCPHGEMKYITGNGAKGPWAGYFCPLEKGNPDQCKAIFVRNR